MLWIARDDGEEKWTGIFEGSKPVKTKSGIWVCDKGRCIAKIRMTYEDKTELDTLLDGGRMYRLVIE